MSNNMNNISSIDASQTDIAYVKTPVVVNLRAAINASATVSVFGPSDESVSNVIWCDVPLDVSGLYSDPSNALIEFWEPSNAPGNIVARIANVGGPSTNRNARAVAQLFSESLANVIKGGMDASAANPFMAYSGPAYTQYDNFGRLALAYAAEGMFGHPSATAAITNDIALVNGFNNDTKKIDDVTNAATAGQFDQALAQRLAAALYGSDQEVATAIAQVVLGQDARRATNVDNSQLQVNQKAPLRFYDGDVVYVKITLANFTASIGNAGSYLAQQYTPSVPKTQDYHLRIRVTAGGL